MEEPRAFRGNETQADQDHLRIIMLLDAVALLAAKLSRVEELSEKIALSLGIRSENLH